MNNHDKLISLIFFKDDVLKNNYFKRFYNNPFKWKNKYPNIKEYLYNRYNDSNSLLETLYRIYYKIEHRPKCKICGKELIFFKSTKKQREKFTLNKCFQTYCSISCEMKDKDIMKKHNDSCIKKYGSVNNTKKQQETCFKKYGVNTLFKDNIFRDKAKEICIKKYGSINNVKKQQETCLKKYNVISSLCLEKCRIKRKSKESLLKEYNTKKVNNSFNQSKIEDESYIILKEKYINVIRQYRSKKYPFNCDFYIPCIDTYIECNYHWTHGNKPYNEEDDNCIFILNKWKNKKSKYYNNAIKTWTDLDVRKRNIAKENNLNWLEFFSINELKKWLQKN